MEKAKIIKWDAAKRHGWVVLAEGRAFVHYLALRPEPIPGQDITGREIEVIEIKRNDKGLLVIKARLLQLIQKPDDVGKMSWKELLARGSSAAAEEFTRRAMVSPEAYQQALDAKHEWNHLTPGPKEGTCYQPNPRYWLGYGKPWFADPGLKFVRFAFEEGSDDEGGCAWAIFLRSDGTYGACTGWRLFHKERGEVPNEWSRTRLYPEQYEVKIAASGHARDIEGPNWDPNEQKVKGPMYIFSYNED